MKYVLERQTSTAKATHDLLLEKSEKKTVMYYRVKCGRCGTVLETDISDWRFDIDRLQKEKNHSIKCPRCGNVNTYKTEEFSLH